MYSVLKNIQALLFTLLGKNFIKRVVFCVWYNKIVSAPFFLINDSADRSTYFVSLSFFGIQRWGVSSHVFHHAVKYLYEQIISYIIQLQEDIFISTTWLYADSAYLVVRRFKHRLHSWVRGSLIQAIEVVLISYFYIFMEKIYSESAQSS